MISRREYLKAMGHKLRKLEKEAQRNKPPIFYDDEDEEVSGLRLRIVRNVAQIVPFLINERNYICGVTFKFWA